MSSDEIRRVIYSKIEELPTLPVALPKILSLVDSERSSAGDIAQVIYNDPALSAKILKVANSAYYGFSKEVTSLENAISLLGLNMVRSLALSIGVVQSLPKNRKLVNFSHEGLWKHSLATAVVTRELLKRPGPCQGRDYLFVVSLLHDIGKAVLDQFFGEEFREAIEETDRSGQGSLHVAEKRLIGYDHGQVGAMLLQRWQFPEAISRPILLHHQDGPVADEAAADVAMLRVSDALAYELGLGEAGNPVGPELRAEDLGRLGLSADVLAGFKSEWAWVEESVSAFYSAIF